jgi:LysR family transcriptional activator of glutamate synthase operon
MRSCYLPGIFPALSSSSTLFSGSLPPDITLIILLLRGIAFLFVKSGEFLESISFKENKTITLQYQIPKEGIFMELLQLRYFQTVAQMKSITKAANYYHIPQPAMSQTISRLEREIGGIKLFDRKNNRIHLNEKGRTFLEYVDRALLELNNGISSLTFDESNISGSIHILVMENRRFIMNCISKFADIYPNVKFSISHDYYSDQPQSYDLCISSTRSYQQMHSYLPFIKEQIVLAVHEQHPLAQHPWVELSELCEEKFITMPSRSSLYSITYENCRSCGFEPHVPFICDDPYFVRKYISENMGIALAPALSWKGRFRSNTKLIPIKNPSIYMTSYLIWDDRRYLTPAICKLREFLLQETKNLAENLLNYDL